MYNLTTYVIQSIQDNHIIIVMLYILQGSYKEKLYYMLDG